MISISRYCIRLILLVLGGLAMLLNLVLKKDIYYYTAIIFMTGCLIMTEE